MKKYLLSPFLILTSALLVACGGGGGGSGAATSATATDAQGFYVGTSSFGFDSNVLILETGEFYSIFSSGGLAYGIDYGTASGTNNAFAGSLTEFYIPYNITIAGTIAGTVVPKSSISGSTNYANGTSGTFTGSYNSAYDTPATAAAIAGTYTGSYYTGAQVTMVISSVGVVTGTSTNCTFTGTAVPRPTGKNVYNMSLTFTGSQCAPGAGVASGVAVLGTVSGNTYIYTAGINSANTGGFFWIGRKN